MLRTTAKVNKNMPAANEMTEIYPGLTVGQVISTMFPNGTSPSFGDILTPSEEPRMSTGYSEIRYLFPPAYPTDVFAVTSYLVTQSGLLNYFDPDPDYRSSENTRFISFTLSMEQRDKAVKVGKSWAINSSIPIFVNQLWKVLLAARHSPLRASTYSKKGARRKQPPKWWIAVLQLLVISDEACVGLGAPPDPKHPRRWLVDFFQQRYAKPFQNKNKLVGGGYRAERQSSTFGYLAESDIGCVQPKDRIAGVGCNLRNLSQNVAFLAQAGSVRCHWQQPILSDFYSDDADLDILIIPLPFEMKDDWITPTKNRRPDPVKRPNWGNFEIRQGWLEDGDALVDFILGQLRAAKAKVKDGTINVVVFPEYALNEALFQVICSKMREVEPKLEFAICGSSTNCEGEEANFVLTAVWYAEKRLEPLKSNPSKFLLTSRRKHHRWRLNGDQIRDYDLTTTFDTNVAWWETHSISQREIHFFHFRQSSTFTAMICEDLARSDPCHDILRSVGPNLLFALLMDGPQIKTRWPARYASTLADDPGTAVLTVTSLGLIERQNVSGSRYPPSRAIGMWKADNGELKSLDMEEGCKSHVLTLLAETNITDQTIDGRKKLNTRTWRYGGDFSVPPS